MNVWIDCKKYHNLLVAFGEWLWGRLDGIVADSKKIGKYDIDGSIEASQPLEAGKLMCWGSEGVAAVGGCHTPHLARIGQGLSFLLLQQPDNQNTSQHNAMTLEDLWTSLLHFKWPSDPS